MVTGGWHVVFTMRGLARPLGHEPLLDVIGDLDEWLDERGVLDGQPFLISPDGRYDVALNRYFEQARMSAAPWNTQAAHARDLKNFLDFLGRTGRASHGVRRPRRTGPPMSAGGAKIRAGRGWSTRPGIVRSRRSMGSSPGPSARDIWMPARSCNGPSRSSRHLTGSRHARDGSGGIVAYRAAPSCRVAYAGHVPAMAGRGCLRVLAGRPAGPCVPWPVRLSQRGVHGLDDPHRPSAQRAGRLVAV